MRKTQIQLEEHLRILHQFRTYGNSFEIISLLTYTYAAFSLMNSPATIRQSKEGWSSSTMDDDEEAYFNASDDDDNDRPSDAMNPAHKDTPVPAVRGVTSPLVDYDDEEENDVSPVAGNNINKSVHESPKRPPEKRARNDEDGEDDDLLARGGKQLAGNLGTRRLLLHGPKKLNIEPQPKKAKAED